MLKYSFFVLFFFFVSFAYTQSSAAFDVCHGFQLSTRVANKYSSKLLSLKAKYDGKSKKVATQFNDICDQRSDYFIELNEQFSLMGAQSELVIFVQKIVDDIVSKNPTVKEDYFKVFIQRSTDVNASSYGNGIILVNLGLLARLNTIDELGFVICHEMAHDISNHIFESTLASAEFYFSPEIKTLKKAAKKRYGSFSAQSDIVRRIQATKGLHSRGNETIADSIGAALYLNAGYSHERMMNALAILKDSDKFLFQDTVDIQSLLSVNNYKIEKEDLSDVDLYSSWSRMDALYSIPDSMRTHPHCDERIEHLAKHFDPTNNEIIREITLDSEKQRIQYEYLHCLIEEDQMARALYAALCLKQRGDNSSFVHAIINFTLFDFHYSIKQQEFSSKISFPDRKFLFGYNQVLEFLHAQNSKNFLHMATSYFDEYLTPVEDFELKKLISLYQSFIVTKKLNTLQIKDADFQNESYKDFLTNLKNKE